MAIYTNLPVYKDSYKLLLSMSRLMSNLSRDYRYTIGQELQQKLLDVIILIYRANRTVQKVPILGRMRETMLEVQVLIRVLSDLRQISEGQYTTLAAQTVSLSKQMSAWEKSERNKTMNREANNDRQTTD